MSSNKEPSDPTDPKDKLDPDSDTPDSVTDDDATTVDVSKKDVSKKDGGDTDGGDDKKDTADADTVVAASTRTTTNTERREAAKRKLKARLDAEQRARKKRKIIISSVSAAVVIAIVGTATYFIVDKIQTDRFNAAHKDCTYTDKPNNLQTVPVQPPPQVQPNQYELYRKFATETNEAVRLGQAKIRTVPKPDDKQPNSGTTQGSFNTNQGAIPVTFDHASAPCNTGAVISLIDDKFYDGTPCHRMTTGASLKVLQCGDPTATGQSGPGWASPDEPPTNLQPAGPPSPYGGAGPVIYPRGTIAIANSNNSGQASNTGSSQFFLVIQDSQLAADYSVVGKVDEAGLAVLDKIYAGGITPGPAGQAQDGRPKLPVEIQTATVD
ncbi:peptidylprolyl isomerase [Gordonia sp. NPDC003422]